MKIIAGIDIGGTKCAISFAQLQDGEITFLDKVRWETDVKSFDNTMEAFISNIQNKLDEHADWELAAIGVSCGGPLDPEKGLIMAPPNLPYWDGVDVYTPLTEKFDVPVAMRNDADACALAEWKLGAGKGSRNMIFLTFGTGIGAGLDGILDCMARFGRVALLGCTRSSDFTIDYYRKVHGPGITLIGAHTMARPIRDSSDGWWTEWDDFEALLKLTRLGRIRLSDLVEEIHSPEEAPAVYERLCTEKTFPLVQFDWRRLK